LNPALKELGFDAQDRVVIIHADDIGMCQAALPALADLLDFGLLSSAAAMVPCSWFPQAAAFCRDHPEVDMGVHLTINSEWDTYRWGPISTRDPASGMLDDRGYFHSRTSATEQHADPQAVAVELQAQVARALQAGIDVTHVDAHMFAVAQPPFLQSYVQVALDNRLPSLFLRVDEESPIAETITPEHRSLAARIALQLEERGIPIVDALVWMPLEDPSDHVAVAKKLIDELRPGLTVLLLHPAHDTPELRAMAPDWPSRVANYQAFMSHELRDYVRQSGVQVIGYRPLRDLIRASV
jgi:predicted glycoside hydrolase/deacetylase ChbG (UPF0249 family)